MSSHVTAWLDAFHDGELDGRQRQMVELHLSQCAACRKELAELQTISTWLQASPAANDLMPEERFVAQVILRLPRRPVRPSWQRTLEAGWKLIPVGLLGAWSFVQTVLVVAGVISVVTRLGLAAPLLLANSNNLIDRWLESTQFDLSHLGQIAFQTLLNGGPLGWVFIGSIAAPIMIGILYWSWWASWWIRQQHSLKTE